MCHEPKDDDELQNINILETQGSRDFTAPDVPTNPMSQPLKIWKVNIKIEENPKFSSVGDYLDEETMEKIADLLHEFQDLFHVGYMLYYLHVCMEGRCACQRCNSTIPFAIYRFYGYL